MRRWFLTLAAASLMAAPVVMSGCAARTRYYDADRRDYRQWNSSEQVFYVRWENDTLSRMGWAIRLPKIHFGESPRLPRMNSTKALFRARTSVPS